MDRFDVILVGLEDERKRAQTIAQLQSMFRMDEQMVVLMLATAPTTVKRDVSSDEAEKYFLALKRIGIKVELRRNAGAAPTVVGHGAGAPGEAPADGTPSTAAGTPAQGAAGPGPKPDSDDGFDPGPSFWSSLPDGLLLPLRGTGIKWLVATSITGFVFLTLLIFGGSAALLAPARARIMATYPLVFVAATGIIFVGVLYNYLRVCLWATLGGDESPQRIAEIGPPFIANDILKPGAIILAHHVGLELFWFALGYQLSRDGIALGTLLATPIVGFLILGILLYWPMGMGLAALNNSALAFWNIGTGLRVIAAAPLEYIAMSIVSNLVWVAPWFFLAVLAALIGPMAAFMAGLFFGPILAYSQAMQGSLLGHIFRVHAPLLQTLE
ncbi:MAG: hypothetical protein KC417_02040 [Myxococcales bacterium]|nr:hypothetical protein [Myxococcales bacterium]